MTSFWLSLASILGLLVISQHPLQGQILVYKVEIAKTEGVNFHTYEGGYVAAPLLGGGVSFLLTTSADGRSYVEAASAGTLFTAVTNTDVKKSVLFSTTGADDVSGAIVAMGDINHVVRVNNRTVTLAVKVARSLSGTLVSADDESSSTTLAEDASIGSAGIAEVKLILDETQTNQANREGKSIEATLDALKLELERQGYSSASEEEPIDSESDSDGTEINDSTEISE